MDEFTAILKARQFVRNAGIDSAPVDIERLAAAANARVKIRHDLSDDESGQTFPLGANNIIAVNGRHREERQRFTVLHEIAHIVLELTSQHHGSSITTSDLMSYERRPEEEILCDVFAAECLLPYTLFRKDISGAEISLDVVNELAERYKASVTSTGSRFAVNAEAPCAFILVEGGNVRYISRSKFLRELNGWIEFGIPVPQGSVAHRLIRAPLKTQDYDEIATHTWFNNGVRNFDLLAEEAILLREWDQCLSLIWFDESLRSASAQRHFEEEDDPLLRELDGVLPWPSKSRRK